MPFWRYALPAQGGERSNQKYLNFWLEIRNVFVLIIWILDLRAGFGFRASDFGFIVSCLKGPVILVLNQLLQFRLAFRLGQAFLEKAVF
jgi:hypothetical protein